ncbi:hypothetical protein LRY60_04330 [Candidatus Woesebacteria bacterium]|nr:hypothetical protein [Candidatus Woesebacteria bacterium]
MYPTISFSELPLLLFPEVFCESSLFEEEFLESDRDLRPRLLPLDLRERDREVFLELEDAVSDESSDEDDLELLGFEAAASASVDCFYFFGCLSHVPPFVSTLTSLSHTRVVCSANQGNQSVIMVRVSLNIFESSLNFETLPRVKMTTWNRAIVSHSHKNAHKDTVEVRRPAQLPNLHTIFLREKHSFGFIVGCIPAEIVYVKVLVSSCPTWTLITFRKRHCYSWFYQR